MDSPEAIRVKIGAEIFKIFFILQTIKGNKPSNMK
jgi:hypothetical protein